MLKGAEGCFQSEIVTSKLEAPLPKTILTVVTMVGMSQGKLMDPCDTKLRIVRWHEGGTPISCSFYSGQNGNAQQNRMNTTNSCSILEKAQEKVMGCKAI